MPSNKDRLYVGLYVRGGTPAMPGCEDKYHWSLLTGPKREKSDSLGMCYHAREDILNQHPEWRFEAVEARIVGTTRLLVRVLIAKVKDQERLFNILQQVPISSGQAGWNCVSWVKEALERLSEDDEALGRKVLDWERVRDAAIKYCQLKHEQHYFDGTRDVDPNLTPTHNLLSEEEMH